MATEIKLRRGTKAQHDDGSGFTGALGEVTVDTTDDTLRVHDGSLKGGHVIAKLSDVEASDTLSELLAKGNSTGSNDIQVDGTDKVTFGAESGGKLEIYEDGSQNGVIKQTGTGALKISGIYGTLNNDSDEELISWDTDNAGLSWRGASGAGLKLFTKETGIGVTGTVNASDGLTADYIDLTGGKSTTTTGAICADQIRFSAEGSDEAKIYASVDGLNTSLFIQSNDDEADKVRVVAGGTESLTVSKTGIDVTGTVEADGVKLGDNEKIQLGASQDLEIFHDGTNSYLQDVGDGQLILNTTNGGGVYVQSAGETMAQFISNGAVNLYHDNAQKFATTETGIDVTGTVTADGVALGNNEKITFGGESDGKLEIYESTGGNGFIEQTGNGNLSIKGQDITLSNNTNQTLIKTLLNTAQLFHRNGDNAGLKLETTNTGIDVTGTVTADGLTLGAGEIATFNSGAGGDLQISGDATGSFSLIKQTGGGDLIIQGQNGSLRNDANDAVIAWFPDYAALAWRGASGSGTKLTTTEAGIDVTGTVEANAFSGTGNAAITDFITDVSASNNDTTVPTTAAVKSYVDNNDGDTTYTGGTGLTLDGTTFNVDAAQTQITSVGALDAGSITSGFGNINNGTNSITTNNLYAGSTTVSGNLEVKSTTADGNFLPEIRLTRNGGVDAGDDGDVLGALVFEGDSFDGSQKNYARIGASIKDDGTGITGGQVEGEIRFACAAGDDGAPELESPSARIDSQGIHTNESILDGTGNKNFFHTHNCGSGGGLKFHSNDGNHTTTIKAKNPSADQDITIPNVTGDIVVASIAGGSINGGGDTTTPRTTWSISQFVANPNSTYVHFNNDNTNDLTISVPFVGVDAVTIGSSFKFINASPSDSDIIIDIDAFSFAGTAAYALTKLDGSSNSVIYSFGSNLTIDSGGQITLTAVSAGVWLVEGIGYS